MNEEQHPSATFTLLQDTKPPKLVMRMSNIGSCRRAIAFAARETSPAPPGHRAQVLDLMHQKMCDVAREYLRLEGWKRNPKYDNPQPIANQEIEDINIYGKPDMVASHPRFTLGQDAAIVFQTRTLLGVSHHIGLKAAALRAPMLTDNPDLYPKVIIAVFNSNNLDVQYHEVDEGAAKPHMAYATSYLKTVINHLQTASPDEIFPPRDHASFSRECQNCPWLSRCGPG